VLSARVCRFTTETAPWHFGNCQ